jgi:hypothetical protein
MEEEDRYLQEGGDRPKPAMLAVIFAHVPEDSPRCDKQQDRVEAVDKYIHPMCPAPRQCRMGVCSFPPSSSIIPQYRGRICLLPRNRRSCPANFLRLKKISPFCFPVREEYLFECWIVLKMGDLRSAFHLQPIEAVGVTIRGAPVRDLPGSLREDISAQNHRVEPRGNDQDTPGATPMFPADPGRGSPSAECIPYGSI